MSTIPIILADAHFLIREGIKRVLREEKNMQVVAEADNEETLLNLLGYHQAKVLIIDYDQPGAFSKATISRVKERFAECNILVISSDRDQNNIFEILETKVNSFLTKECDQKEIIDAVQATAKGDKFFCTNVLNVILERSIYNSEDETCKATPLSPRELQILKLVAEGKIAKEIAGSLNLSTHTVYTHRKNILRKLNLTSTSDLVLYALELGLIDHPTSSDN